MLSLGLGAARLIASIKRPVLVPVWAHGSAKRGKCSARASGGAKLLKLAVERLSVGRDASIADEPFFGLSFGHILCKP